MTMNTRKRKSRIYVVAILMLSGAGAWISGELVTSRADIWDTHGSKATILDRLCHITERAGFDCSGAVDSRWSQIVVPIPMPTRRFTMSLHWVVLPASFLGLAYFVFMGAWFGFVGGPRRFGRRWHRLTLHLSRCGAAISLFYVGVMAFGLAPWCVGCCAIHAINLTMALLISRLCHADGRRDEGFIGDFESPEQTARLTMTTREAARAVGFALILIVGLWHYRGQHLAFKAEFEDLRPYKQLVTSLRTDPDFVLREYEAQPRHRIPPRPGESASEDRPRLVVFTDFQCPACSFNAKTVYGEISKAFGGRLDVSIRHFPLCHACNAGVRGEGHRNACQAAYAAEASRILGGEDAFRKMHLSLIENQESLGRPLYRRIASEIGLDVERFVAEMDGETVRKLVKGDIALAMKLGVTGTPAMYLNGRSVTELCKGSTFWKAVAKHVYPSPDSEGLSVGETVASHISKPLEE